MKGFAGDAKTGKTGRSTDRWLANPTTPVEAELRAALDQAAARAADEVALRRVWARLADLPALGPAGEHGREQSNQRLVDGRAGRGRWAWIVAASLAGATVTLAFMLIETKSEFRAERASPGLALSRESANGGGAGTAEQRSTIVAPATVRTGFGETLHLALRGGTQVTVTSESTLILDQNERPTVSSGEVQFRVPHQPAGQTFAVMAANYRVVVMGTQFRVRVGDSNAAVGVDEGVVEVWTDHRVARLTGGESWVGRTTAAARGAETEPAASQPSQPAPTITEPANRPEAHHAKANVMPGRAVQHHGGTRSALRVSARGPRQVLALSSPSGSSSASSSFSTPSSSSTAPVAAVNRVAPPTAKDAVVSRVAPTEAPAAVASADKVDNTPLAVQARAARAAGDTQRALGLYRTLAQKGGAAGENAEYEIARLMRDGLHQPREAVSAWRLYRAQHPRGLLRIEADISVIETLTALGDKVGAIAEAKDFMRRYPDSERRTEIARLAGDLLRERGDCTDAVGAYDLALGSAHGRKDLSDSASYHRAVCLMRGDREAGMAAVHAYVGAYPEGRYRIEAQRLLNGAESATRQQR